jgi:hypothetical protein
MVNEIHENDGMLFKLILIVFVLYKVWRQNTGNGYTQFAECIHSTAVVMFQQTGSKVSLEVVSWLGTEL